MEQRLKERLTGAAILVALVVLVVPELFHGHSAERDARSATANEGPPLRSYMINLGGGDSAPLQLDPPGPATPIAAGAPVPTGSALEPAPPTASAPAVISTTPVPVTAPPAPSPSPTVAAAPEPPARSEPPAAPALAATHPAAKTHITDKAHPAAKTHPVAKTHPAARGAHARASREPSRWSVQLGLFAERANAERMVHVAHVKGFAATVSRPDARGRYRVRVADVGNRSAALTLAARLRAAGLPAAPVAPK